MADIRIKDLATTASTTASDDFLAVDGTTNGTRKLSAATPSFATSVTVPGVAGPTATNLTLTGGSTGASLVLGQGASGAVTITPKGTGKITGIVQNASSVEFTDAAAATFRLTPSGSAGAGLITIGTSSLNTPLAFAVNDSGTISEGMRLSKGNLLIGGTTDITGSGGLKVFGTTAASSTTTGALQVAGGVGVAGTGYFGGAVLSGAQYVITGNGSVPTASTIAIGTNGAGSRMLLNVPSAGEINFNVNGSLVSAISSTRSFYATQIIESVNSTASTGAGTGALQVAGGIYAGAASYFASTLTNVGQFWNSSTGNTTTNGFNDATNIAGNIISVYASTGSANIQKVGRITVYDGGSGYYGLNLQAPTSAYPNFGGTVNYTNVLTLTSQAATFAGAVTAGAITSTGASAALNVTGTLGAVVATVSSGSSIAGSGQGILSLNISDQQWSVRNAAGPFSIRDDTSGNYYLNITRATGAVRFHAYGAGTATFDSSGNITSVSDARLKNITGTFTKGLAEIVKLTPKLYTWKPDTGLVTDDINATLIAQDLIAAGIPEAVTTYRTVAVMEDDVQSAEDIAEGKPVTQHAKLDADGKPVTQRVDANYSVSDRTVIAALVNAVKELKAEIDALKAAK